MAYMKQAVLTLGQHRAAILVDDTRLMGTEWSLELDKVKELLLDINKDYKLSFEDGFLDPRTKTKKFENDILVATL